MTNPISFTPDSPQGPNEAIATSVTPFLNNFISLYNAFAVNHVPLDAASLAGNHTIVQMPEQTGNFPVNNGEVGIYCREIPGQTDQLMMKYQGTQPEFQYTNYQIYTTGGANQFISFLPGKLLVYFGARSGNFSATTPIVLNLIPAIAKNIITMNFTVLGPTPQFTPRTTFEIENGIYTKINLYPGGGISGGIKQATFNFIVLANI